MKNYLYILFTLILFSCTSSYYRMDLKRIQTNKDNRNISMIYGTYSFSDKFCFLSERIGLNVQREGKISPDTYFAFENESGDFLFPLEPGKYKIVSLSYIAESTYEIYDSQLLDFSFEALPGEIIYLGNFTLNISFDVEYIYWGISEIKNEFEEDRKDFLNKYTNLDNFSIKAAVPKKLGKIKKLKYSPASRGTNI